MANFLIVCVECKAKADIRVGPFIDSKPDFSNGILKKENQKILIGLSDAAALCATRLS